MKNNLIELNMFDKILQRIFPGYKIGVKDGFNWKEK